MAVRPFQALRMGYRGGLCPAGPAAARRTRLLNVHRQRAVAPGLCSLLRRGQCGLLAPRRRPAPLRTAAAYGWPPEGDPLAVLARLRTQLEPVWAAVAEAVQAFVEAQRRWLQGKAAHALLGAAVLLATATAVVNVWGVPSINSRVLPWATDQVARILQREVELGAVRWVSPAGVTGLMPLASVGPISLGASPVEHSTARVERLLVGVDLLQSLLQGRIILTTRAVGAELHLVQCSNFSWFGYPDDTEPSARNFVPGLSKANGSDGSNRPGGDCTGSPAPPPAASGDEPSSGPAAAGGSGAGCSSAGFVQSPTDTGALSYGSQPASAAQGRHFWERIAQEVQACLVKLQGAPSHELPVASVAARGAAAKRYKAGRPSKSSSTPNAEASAVAELNRMRLSASARDAVQPAAPANAAVLSGMPAAQPEGEAAPAAHAAELAAPSPASPAGSLTLLGPAPSQASAAALLNKRLRRVGLGSSHLYTAQPLAVPQPSGAAVSEAAAPRMEAAAVQQHAAKAETPSLATEAAQLPRPEAADNGAESAARPQQSGAAGRINALTAVRRLSLQEELQEQLDGGPKPAAGSADGATQAVATDAGPGEEPAWQPVAVSREVQLINGLCPLTSESCTTSATAAAESSKEALIQSAVDPSTLRKRGGSAALPWAKSRAPVQTALARRSGRTRPAAAPAAQPANAVLAMEAAEADAGQAESSDSHQQFSAESATADAKHGAGHKQHLLHPGYFTVMEGPAYTPAPPEALAERRARWYRGLQALLKRVAGAVMAHVHAPAVALGGVQAERLTLLAHIHGEELPRRFENVSASVRLGRNYDSLALHITAQPHERDPASRKCTMLNPTTNRNLRHVTGLAALAHSRSSNDAPHEEEAAAAAAGPSAARAMTPGQVAPNGGDVTVDVKASGIVSGNTRGGPTVPTLEITVAGRNLHAPLIERVIELPIDIHSGRADGYLTIKAHDAASWHFPEFFGRVSVRGADFHFWDAPDDIVDASLDLLFEKDRLYLHNATGKFGSVPMTLTGDLDVNPDTGHYRLSADVPGVEANQLRATLGVRPMPFSVATAVTGTLHITGPLEKPVFSGMAIATRPTDEMLADCEPTNALEVLKAEPDCVGVYDKIPFKTAQLVFTLDTAKETMLLHAFNAEPLDGGQLSGSGRMWVAPKAEMDPSAVSVTAQGTDLPAHATAQRYLPDGAALPPGMVLGKANLTASMKGSHLAPTIDVAFQLPEVPANGNVQLTREGTRLNVVSPYGDAIGTVFMVPPTFEAIKSAITQEQASALAVPNVRGCDADITFKGMDVMPLFSDEPSLQQLAQQSGQSVRLRLTGNAKVSGAVCHDDDDTAGWKFGGSLGLDNLRLNQLKIFKKLEGSFEVSEHSAKVHAKGLRQDEALNLDLALPLLPPPSTASAPAPTTSSVKDVDIEEPAHTAAEGVGAASPVRKPSRLAVRSSAMSMAVDMDGPGSQLDVKVQGLCLDELELASLRGDLQELSCSLNFGAQTGRGRLALAGPRFSGLRGESLTAGVRWERDVVRLERAVLQQRCSKYELQGEYVVPSYVLLPTSAADLAVRHQPPPGELLPGRWRLAVAVPGAELQEIVPAARLLQSAGSLAPTDYQRAKQTFMTAISRGEVASSDLDSHIRQLLEGRPAGAPYAAQPTAGADALAAGGPPGGDGAGMPLPGLQEVRGQWSGTLQAYGGGSSATSLEFDLRGASWSWGSRWGLDSMVANGAYHSEEGVQLQEVVLKSGVAKLVVRGSLLSDAQDATVHLTDFPVATFRPLFRAIPALQHAVPAVSADNEELGPKTPLRTLTKMIGTYTQGLQRGAADVGSPINGVLFLSGTVRGSKDRPTGEVAMQLYDGAIGATRLASAKGSARLSEAQHLTFNVDIVPSQTHHRTGHLKASGIVPLGQAEPAHAEDGAIASVAAARRDQMDVRLSVRDGGMAVLTSISPDLTWQSGNADISFRVSGTLDQPLVSGSARISKAMLGCPHLKAPLRAVAAEVECTGGELKIGTLEARSGSKGSLRVTGSLPLRSAPSTAPDPSSGIKVDAASMGLSVRNAFTGELNATLRMRDSLERPTVGGLVRLSRGTVELSQGGLGDTGSTGAELPQGEVAQQPSSSTWPVAKTFELLTRGDGDLTLQLESVIEHEVEAVEHAVADAGQYNVLLDQLRITLGPDLRAVYPFVLNFSVEGDLTLTGPASPDQVQVAGTLRLPSGFVNLVATQLSLERGHPNELTFVPASGASLDPVVHLAMNSGDVRVAIKGRASEWAQHVEVTRRGAGTVAGVAGAAGATPEGMGALEPAEAAALFESRLKAAMVADDGQLALRRLAGSTVSTLLPKLESVGEVGTAKWRLYSAPSLAVLDPSVSGNANRLFSYIGTELEVQFGRRLQAGVERKMQESDVATRWTFNYSLSNQLRMQFAVGSASPYAKTLTFQYSSDPSPGGGPP